MKLSSIIQFGIQNNFSDLILTPGHKPTFSINGKLTEVENLAVLNQNIILELLSEYFQAEELKKLEKELNLNGVLDIKGLCRLRFNYFQHKDGFGMVFRYIPKEVPKFEDLNLPQSILKTTQYDSGLVIVCGKTSKGKSTTLASLIQKINITEKKHIITIEEPIEFEFQDQKSIIHQREVPTHVESYTKATQECLRQNADIIYISELKEKEAIEKALEAAQTGHLVFASLHASDCVNALNRIISYFPDNNQNQILEQLAANLKAVIWQDIVTSKLDGKMYPLNEIFFSNEASKSLIRKNEIQQIQSIIETGSNLGMQSKKQAVESLQKIGIL